MIQKSEILNRRSIRLKGYDYAQAGAYFVSICAHERESYFGEIKNGTMELSQAGEMVQSRWEVLPERFPQVELDQFALMPNHIHAIVLIVGAPLVGTQIKLVKQGLSEDRAGTRPAPTLGNIIGAFKSITTDEYINGVKRKKWRPFLGKLWQRNYYEHVIRNDKFLNQIREYIIGNPARWEFDIENVERKSDVEEESFWRSIGKIEN